MITIRKSLNFTEIYCLESDIINLPKDETIQNGSVAFCIDTKDILFFDFESKTWV